MLFVGPILAVLLAAASLVGCAQSGVIGGVDYAPEYDYGEFFAVTDGRNFQVIVSGNPFPALSEAEMKRRIVHVGPIDGELGRDGGEHDRGDEERDHPRQPPRAGPGTWPGPARGIFAYPA